MTIRVSNYQTLSLEQLKQFATQLQSNYGGNVQETVSKATTIDDAVADILNFESKLYKENNEQREKIGKTFEVIFQKVRGTV